MRLINADKLIDFINAGHLRSRFEPCFSEDDVVKMIENQPTAFDAEKVVNQLEEEKELSFADFEAYAKEFGYEEDSDDWFHKGLGRAVQIVKEGGVNA